MISGERDAKFETNRAGWMSLLAWLVIVHFIPATIHAGGSAATTRPNIVFILIDDFGYADSRPVWCEGHSHTAYRPIGSPGSQVH